MKVLQINSVCGIRSTGRICTDIAEVLEQYGHECKIAYGRETVPEKYKRYAVRIGNKHSVMLDALKTRLLDNAGFNSVAATKKFLSWVKEYDPDIIHLHNLHGYYIHIGLLFDFLSSYGKPVIWTLHDCWPFTGHCAHYDYVGCDKWMSQCMECPQLKEYPSSLWRDRSRKNHRQKTQMFSAVERLRFVAISDWIAEQKEKSLLKDKQHVVIHNGIDLSVFRLTASEFRKRYGIENKRMYLGVATFWGERKGFDAFKQLSQMITEDEIIVMVGLNTEQIKELPSNIIGIERTDSVQELAEIYTAADVFLNPTVEEALGLVNIEAIACGTPVVTYKTGGSPECITEKSGIAVPKGDVQALLHAARSIQADPMDLQRDAARFDKKQKYLEYLEFYKRCLE